MSRRTEPSETSIGHEVFSSLTGCLLLHGVADPSRVGSDPMDVVAFANNQSDRLDSIAKEVGEICRFSEETMGIYRENEWWLRRDGGEVQSWLALYAGLLEVPPISLEDWHAVNRLVQAGLDGQMVGLLDGLVRGLLRLESDGRFEADRIVKVLVRVSSLGRHTLAPSVSATYRMWRLCNLRPALDPRSSATTSGRDRLRAAAKALEMNIHD